jgi:hypothetical protein
MPGTIHLEVRIRPSAVLWLVILAYLTTTAFQKFLYRSLQYRTAGGWRTLRSARRA